MLPRNVAAQAHFARQRIVAVRAMDQKAEAGVGEARAAVLHHRMDDVAVAALDEHVGDRFAERAALGDGVEVLLALAGGGGDQRRVGQPLRLAEHRARHFDVVVGGEHLDDVRRRIDDRRQPLRQLGARLGFDAGHQAAHHVIEQADLTFGEARCSVDEKIGDAGHDGVAARRGAGGKRCFEFVEEGEGAAHEVVAATPLNSWRECRGSGEQSVVGGCATAARTVNESKMRQEVGVSAGRTRPCGSAPRREPDSRGSPGADRATRSPRAGR